jgi:SPP1 gp7 family putative phage head morphogenesis protein
MRLSELVTPHDFARLQKSAAVATQVERKWVRKAGDLRRQVFDITIAAIKAGKEPELPDKLLEAFFMEHALESWSASLENEPPSASSIDAPKPKRLSSVAKKMPGSLSDLRRLYDAFRKRGTVGPRQRELAKKVNALYKRRVNEWVKRATKDWLAGGEREAGELEARIMKVADVVYARGKMIIETETTRNLNGARRAMYDGNDDVTHYLFVALRDYATTRWCKTRQGLVYKKGDPLLDKETPPCHWNCRSELLPLSFINPQHKRMINDKSRARRNHTCAPLPPGWNG